MIYIIENAWPIILATLAGLAVGVVFLGAAGRRPKPSLIITALIAEGWLAAILAGALILAPPKANPWIMAIGSAVVIWIGFVVPTTVVTLRARSVGGRGVGADCSHWLVVMIVQAVVLHTVGLTPPPA